MKMRESYELYESFKLMV